MLNLNIDRAYIKNLNWKPFDEYDWMGWSGCEAPVPFIATTESGDVELVHILDGGYFTVYGYYKHEPIKDEPIVEIMDILELGNKTVVGAV